MKEAIGRAGRLGTNSRGVGMWGAVALIVVGAIFLGLLFVFALIAATTLIVVVLIIIGAALLIRFGPTPAGLVAGLVPIAFAVILYVLTNGVGGGLHL